jgi:hypothetical protein
VEAAVSAAFEDFAGDTPASTNPVGSWWTLSSSSALRTKMLSLGMGVAGVPGEHLFVETLFEKKK